MALAFQETIILSSCCYSVNANIITRVVGDGVVIRYSHKSRIRQLDLAFNRIERVLLLRCGHLLYYVYVYMGNVAQVQEGRSSKKVDTYTRGKALRLAAANHLVA